MVLARKNFPLNAGAIIKGACSNEYSRAKEACLSMFAVIFGFYRKLKKYQDGTQCECTNLSRTNCFFRQSFKTPALRYYLF